MINLREHFKLTAIYTFFAAFPALLQLIVYPVIEGEARLGATDFGYLAITEAITSAVFILCTFGVIRGLSRFYYEYRNSSNDYNKLVSTVLSGIIARGLLLMGLTLLFAPYIGSLFTQPALLNFSEYGPSIVISGFNRAIVITLLGLYRNEKRLRIFILVSFFSGILRAGFQLLGVLLYDMSFLGYVHGTAIGSSFVVIVIVGYSYYKYGLHYNKSIRKSLLPFIRPLFFSDLIVWGLLFADRFFLLKNPEELGIYDNAMKFAIGIELILQGLSNAIQPEVFRYLKEGVTKKAEEIKTLCNLFIAESTGIVVLAVFPAMLFITLFYETELNLSAGLFTIIFTRFILTSQYRVFAMPVLFFKKTKLFLYINSCILILNIGLNWLLTPLIGYYGAITAFFAAYLIQVVLFYIVQQKIIQIKWNKYKILYLPLAVVFFAICLEIIKLLFNVDPFLTSLIFVLVSLTGLLLLYKKEIKSYMNIYSNKTG